MRSLLRLSQSWKSTHSLAKSARSTQNTAWAFSPVSVHSQSSATPCPTHLRSGFSHKPFALHSPFCASCGSSGKQGLLNTSTHPVFQFPSIPQPRFRKLTHLSNRSLPAFSAIFPLFLPERRVLLSYFFISYTFSSSLVALHSFACKPYHRLAPNSPERSIGLFRPIDTRNPEKYPSFPPPKLFKGEYNQEEEERAVSVRRLLVVQCGQCGICLNRLLR